MNGFVTDGNDINCHECKYGDKCNVGRGHGYRVGSCFQFELEKKQTNADKIRNMTDEELARWIHQTRHNPLEDRNYWEWLEWLKQEEDS